MRRFFPRLTLFSLPFLLLLGLPTAILLVSGELCSTRQALLLQRLDHSLRFGTAFTYPAKALKLAALEDRSPDVLALGTSRVLQVRATAFLHPTAFYNAGGLVSTPGDWRYVATHLPAAVRPRYVLLGIDPWFWNGEWLTKNPDAPQEMLADVNVLNGIQRDWWVVWRDLRSGKLPWAAALGGHGIGISARVRGAGFRDDGSYDYGWFITHPDDPQHWDHAFTNTMSRIERRSDNFEPGGEPDPRSLVALRALLDELKRRGATVVAFIPPFAPSVLSRMRATGDYRYQEGVYALVAPELEARGFSLTDFGDGGYLSVSDDQFIDGYHGSERVYAAMLLALCDRVPALATVVAVDVLRRGLATPGRLQMAEP